MRRRPPGREREVALTISNLGNSPLIVDDYADQGFLTVDSNDPFNPQSQAYVVGEGTL